MKPCNCCCFPFERIMLEGDGEVSFCCQSNNYSYVLGNIFSDSFENLWYGEKAINFRKSILDGSYRYCNLDVCGDFCPWNCFDANGKDKEKLLYPPYPKYINISYVSSCNVRCMTCRDKLCLERPEDTEQFDKITDKVIDLCCNAKTVYLDGSGELFTSNHLKKMVHKLVDKYPNLKFHIHTNGLLCDEQHIKEFGLEGRILSLNISIHSATKKTYETIVRGGHWEQLIQNLEYIKSLNIKEVYFIFVLHSLNYKEMPAFAKMAKKYNAKAKFWRFRNWETSQMCREIDRYSCWESWHPDYKNFIKVLSKLKRVGNYILAEPFLRKLQAGAKDSFVDKIVNFFNKK